MAKNQIREIAFLAIDYSNAQLRYGYLYGIDRESVALKTLQKISLQLSLIVKAMIVFSCSFEHLTLRKFHLIFFYKTRLLINCYCIFLQYVMICNVLLFLWSIHLVFSSLYQQTANKFLIFLACNDIFLLLVLYLRLEEENRCSYQYKNIKIYKKEQDTK